MESIEVSGGGSTLLAYQKRYHTQKRLADSLFGLFRTLGSALHVERVANVGLLTLTGQLLIKCATFFQRRDGRYVLLATAGTRGTDLTDLDFPENLPAIAILFRERGVLDLEEPLGADHPALERLRAHGFRSLFPLADGAEPLGIIALGNKIVDGPLTPDDLQILAAFGVVISVSLKNSLAYELVEANRNELERLNEMKREFLNHVSHEFRTPLTVLKNTVEMTDADPGIKEMQSSALDRLERLVGSVLLLNEINSQGVLLVREPINAREWIGKHVEPLLRVTGDFKLQMDMPDCELEIDASKVDRAVESLLENAVKFGTGGGEVAIYLSTRASVAAAIDAAADGTTSLELGTLRPDASVDPRAPNSMFVVEVKNPGIGVPRHEQRSIFQPFTQAANSPTRGVTGAGLGLAMAKRIVDAHGGEIFCRSQLNQGATFAFAIPTAMSRAA